MGRDHAADLAGRLRGFPAWLPGFAPLQGLSCPFGLRPVDTGVRL
jgi:hypothetical protein